MTLLWRNIRKKGFTLVELLVVIAIIGILVAIVMPAIADALFRGKLTAVAANGRNIVQSIMALETENIYGNSAIVWPMNDTVKTTADPDYFANANDYFYWMMSNEVMNVNPSFFWAQGLTKASGLENFDEDMNAWCIVADVTSKTPETTPVVFTRNLGQGSTFENLDDDLGVTNANNDERPSSVGGNPFQDKGFVFVTKGGAAFALFKETMRGKNFTNLFEVGTNDNVVLRPDDNSY